MTSRFRAALAAAAVLVLVATLTAAAWAVSGTGSAAPVTAAHLDAAVPSTTAVAGGVTLTWPSSTPPPDQWQIVRATSPTGPWSVIATLPGTATTYTDTTTGGGPYYYEVRPTLSSWTGDHLPIGTPNPTGITPLPASLLPLGDTFTRSGSTSLGSTTQTGGAPWISYNSNLPQWLRNGFDAGTSYASTTVPVVLNPMLVVNAQTPNAGAVMRVVSMGDAIYVRVSDANDWLRLRVDQPTTFIADGTYTVFITVNGTGDLVTSFVTTDPEAACASYVGDGLHACSYSPNGSSVTTNSLTLDADNGGIISVLGSWSIGSWPTYVGLTADGASLTVRYGTNATVGTTVATVTSTFNQGATKHGVGLAPSAGGTPIGVGAFTLKAP